MIQKNRVTFIFQPHFLLQKKNIFLSCDLNERDSLCSRPCVKFSTSYPESSCVNTPKHAACHRKIQRHLQRERMRTTGVFTCMLSFTSRQPHLNSHFSELIQRDRKSSAGCEWVIHRQSDVSLHVFSG